MPVKGISLLLAFVGLSLAAVASDGRRDSVSLQEVEVVAPSVRTTRVSDGGKVVVDASLIGRTLRTLGEADAAGYLKLLPGVSGGSDYGSGLSVQGGDYSHTLFRINGAPVFFPYHFGGIFSVVSPSHFPIVKFEKAIHDRSVPGRLGGIVDMSTRRGKLEHVDGSVNVGVISSGLSLGVPVSRTFDVTASARISYIDQLYGNLLKGKSSQINYNLYDIDVTAVWTPGERDRVTADFFYNSDRLHIVDDDYALGTFMKWNNTVGSVSWERRLSWGKMRTSAYYSGFSNTLSMIMPQLGLKMPSEIRQVSVNGMFDVNISDGWRLNAGYDVMLNYLRPQWAEIQDENSEVKIPGMESAQEYAVYGELYHSLTPFLELSAGVRVTGYCHSDYRKLLADPSLTVYLRKHWGTMAFQLAGYTQTLHQVGFSEIGLSSNFWIGSDNEIPVQRAYSAAFNYTKSFLDDSFTVSADIYYKRLSGCSEYDGYILGLLDSHYVSRDNIVSGKGYNYGADILLTKNFGKVTGSVGYAYGIARRRFDGTDCWVTSSSELLHSVNLFARYAINGNWTLSAVFTYNSGRPVTPIKAIYMVGENVFMDYGRRNSGNLPAYHRLDLSATYAFRSERWLKLRHYVNVSLLNAYGHRNIDVVSYNYDAEKNVFKRKEVTSLYRFMPSLSYTVEF